MEWKHIDSPVKEKGPGAVFNKEGHADNFKAMKGPITVDFLEKNATVNRTSYCRLLRQYFTLFVEQPPYDSGVR